MKLRIKGDTIRMRLTRPEVEALGRGIAAEEVTHFPDGASLRYRLETTPEGAALSAGFADGLLVVRLGLQAAARWSSGSTVGIECALPLASGRELKILIEKDFECLNPARGENQQGAYPNPEASSNKC